jgi:hypothetical protein
LEQSVTESQLAPVGPPATLAAQINFDPLDRYGLFSASLMNSVAFVPGTPFRFYLQWINRNGGEAESILNAGDYYAFKLAPDGLHLLTNLTDGGTGSTGVWSVDLNRSTMSPVTSGGVDFFPIWSPDGLQIALAKSSGTAERGMRLVIVPNVGGEGRIALDVKGPVFPSDWSGNGAFLAYTGYRPLAAVMVLSLGEGVTREVWSYSPVGHSAGGGVFKPTHHREPPQWIAYTSDESGRDEVYLQSLSMNRAKMQVSTSGGNRPLWRSDGQELYFVNARQELCAVNVPDSSANIGTPHPLFKLSGSQQAIPPYSLDYAVSLDGQKFLVRREDSSIERSVVNLIR